MVQTESGSGGEKQQDRKREEPEPRYQERVRRSGDRKGHVAKMTGLYREEKLGERLESSGISTSVTVCPRFET